ncbi:MAG: hypothetical protein ACQKBV_04820, partial [Puniceicoccales bacterium]
STQLKIMISTPIPRNAEDAAKLNQRPYYGKQLSDSDFPVAVGTTLANRAELQKFEADFYHYWKNAALWDDPANAPQRASIEAIGGVLKAPEPQAGKVYVVTRIQEFAESGQHLTISEFAADARFTGANPPRRMERKAIETISVLDASRKYTLETYEEAREFAKERFNRWLARHRQRALQREIVISAELEGASDTVKAAAALTARNDIVRKFGVRLSGNELAADLRARDTLAMFKRDSGKDVLNEDYVAATAEKRVAEGKVKGAALARNPARATDPTAPALIVGVTDRALFASDLLASPDAAMRFDFAAGPMKPAKQPVHGASQSVASPQAVTTEAAAVLAQYRAMQPGAARSAFRAENLATLQSVV